MLILKKIKRLSSSKLLKIEQKETLNQIITNGLVLPTLEYLRDEAYRSKYELNLKKILSLYQYELLGGQAGIKHILAAVTTKNHPFNTFRAKLNPGQETGLKKFRTLKMTTLLLAAKIMCRRKKLFKNI